MSHRFVTALPVLFTVFFCSEWASAATLIVGKPNTGCTGAQYSTIIDAVNAASSGDTIQICPALYPEQLTLTKPLTLIGTEVNGVQRVLLQPASMSPSAGLDGAVGSLPFEAVITVMNTQGVSIQNLAIDASKNGITGCNTLVAGVHFYNSSGALRNSAIYGAQTPGCTGDNALVFGNGFGVQIDADQTGRFDVAVDQNSIHDFTRDGIQVVSPGVTARINGNAISGAGPGGGVFQFGVFVLNGAVGQVTNNIIHEGSCGALSQSDCLNARSEGVTLRAAGDGTVIDRNTITTAQSGIFLNGATNVQVINNVISDIDLLDGIDIQGSASGSFTGGQIVDNTILNLGPVENESCGIFELTASGVSGNTIAHNTVNDGYCGVAAVAADHVSGGVYYNTLYAEINADLPTPPPPVEPSLVSNGTAKAVRPH